MKTKKKKHSVLTFLGFALILAVSWFPILWVILSSFKSNVEILSGKFWPSQIDFRGYIQAFKSAPIASYFLNSVILAVVSTALNVFLLAMAAYVFARVRFRFKKVLFTLIMSTMVIPSTALMQPIFRIISGLGLVDTYTGLTLVYTGFGFSLTMLILRSAMMGIPLGIEEAASIDGASFPRIFFTMILPISKSALACAAVIHFLDTWNEFTYALLLTVTQRVRTLPLAVNYFTSQFSFNYTAMFAAITIAVVPSIIIFIIFQEQVISSMTVGAVKE